MNKTLSVALILALTLALCPCARAGAQEAQEKEITIFVNGVHLEPDTPPMIEDGRTLVPLRSVFEAMGAEVGWDGESRTATVVRGGVSISVTIDAPVMMKNGEAIPLEVPARIVNGRTMIPVRAVAEGLEAEVDWDGENRHVLIDVPMELSFDSLAAEDAAHLRDSVLSIRYSFEHSNLSSYFFSGSGMAASFNRHDPQILTAVADVWREGAVSELKKVQSRSRNTYTVPEGLTPDELEQGYERALKSAGLAPEDIFTVSFEDVPGVGAVLLVSFNSYSVFANCMYIAVAVDRNNNLRFFSAENDPAVPYQLVLWEATPNGSGIWSRVDPEKDAFLQAVNLIIQRGAPVEITIFGPR